jgi:hypothetical protein
VLVYPILMGRCPFVLHIHCSDHLRNFKGKYFPKKVLHFSVACYNIIFRNLILMSVIICTL